jgi:hypothetical protein
MRATISCFHHHATLLMNPNPNPTLAHPRAVSHRAQTMQRCLSREPTSSRKSCTISASSFRVSRCCDVKCLAVSAAHCSRSQGQVRTVVAAAPVTAEAVERRGWRHLGLIRSLRYLEVRTVLVQRLFVPLVKLDALPAPNIQGILTRVGLVVGMRQSRRLQRSSGEATSTALADPRVVLASASPARL